ncbi:toll/interleukin-1 receptor domain-containing protein [Pararhodospirillum oryzae]|uniref:TIR domain-containing protein n=1 Tax=Pararhodospirillum oryzae TaxID=478448 RepID=A0A512H5P0_9PROT|nr:toll/interleukin-1 receptor domain-containing protein [Pararhodospirillum oryzae]GEO80734.1 hypothetical protein ROR02_08650 [Pararhodospirillum oryzae]
MSALYTLAFLGTIPPGVETALRNTLAQALASFGLALDRDVEVAPLEALLKIPGSRARAALYFGAPGAVDSPALSTLIGQYVPMIPVVSRLDAFQDEIPPSLRHLNGMALGTDPDYVPLGMALLECVGLLPRQRRIFLSYRRNEAGLAALQLYENLCSRKFDVFLDTHDILPGQDFQETLWHRLRDCDVLVMLHTPTYFGSPWTRQEFHRALARQVSILRLGWPGSLADRRTALAHSIDLDAEEIEPDGRLSLPTVEKIWLKVESLRSASLALRHASLAGAVTEQVTRIGGSVEGIGAHRSMALTLPRGKKMTAFTCLGVPSAEIMHDHVLIGDKNAPLALVYDAQGYSDRLNTHLTWLGRQITDITSYPVHNIGWGLAALEDS